MSTRSLTANVDDAISILGADDDYRRELLLYVLLHGDPRTPIGEAIYKEVVGKLYAATAHGKQAIEDYKSSDSHAIFDQGGPPSLRSRAQPFAIGE